MAWQSRGKINSLHAAFTGGGSLNKDIYKITNTVNGKIYIGQSVDPVRRFKDHYYGSNKGYASKIHNAIAKYGVDAFTLEILEHNVPNYNERERYWINYYHSNNRDIGYNITDGGENPPILRGEDSPTSKFTDDNIRMICGLLRDTDLSYIEICERFGISDIYVQRINSGKSRKIDGFEYPIRKQSNCRKSKELAEDVAYDLYTTSKSLESIARKYKVDSNFVYNVNNGIHKNCSEYYCYPIRSPYKRIPEHTIASIFQDLSDCREKMSTLEKKYGLSHATMSRINRGEIYHDNNIEYPIRKSSQRVYKPVETIPGETGSRVVIDTQPEMALSEKD